MKYLDLKKYIYIIVLISISLYLLYLWIFPLKNFKLINYLTPIPKIISIDIVIVFCFTRWLWKLKCLYGYLVPFPNLNGTWKGVIKSNWVCPDTGKKLPPIPVMLTIKQSFINISCVMRTKEMTSYSFVSDFWIDRDNQILKLVYSYNSNPTQEVKHRSPQHSGTICFDVINNKEKRELHGDYWTERKTTGRIELSFWKKDFLEKFPEELIS